jgi:hypothetical protein
MSDVSLVTALDDYQIIGEFFDGFALQQRLTVRSNLS